MILGDTSSEWTEVTSGVPQGSVLGPTLFIIYINDMPDKILSTIKLFADDSKLLTEIDPDNPSASTNILQLDIQRVTEWSEDWLMELNIEKCKIMHIGKKNPEIDYFMKCTTTNLDYKINTSISERDLGVNI